ncbi:MAG: transposase [Candidatus Tectimicrobiota bacterium]
MLGTVFDRFVEKSPISVMVRGTLERVLGAEHLDAWFAQTAQKQYTRTVLFSTVYEILSHVVFRIKPSVRAAYRDHEAQVGASLIAVYNKLNGVETHTSAALVRYSAAALRPLITQLDGERASWLPGYRVKILDGNCIEASERRLKVVREVQAGALPGKSLVVYEPTTGLVREVFPCEDGHAQERALLGQVLETVQAQDLWIQDRNFCTCAFLGGIDSQGAGFITRQHEGLPFEEMTPLRPVGRMATGHVAEQWVQVRDAQDVLHRYRRIRVIVDQATRDGDGVLYILTNVPRHHTSAKRIARLYRKCWTLETAFQHLEAYFHSEINTLGYPKAALFGFCLALVASNMLAVVMAALRSVHGAPTIDDGLSLYYVAHEIAQTYQGMMIAIPEEEWRVFSQMGPAEMVATLRVLAQKVRLNAYRKSSRGPKKPRPKREGITKTPHVSTATLLRKCQGSAVAN